MNTFMSAAATCALSLLSSVSLAHVPLLSTLLNTKKRKLFQISQRFMAIIASRLFPPWLFRFDSIQIVSIKLQIRYRNQAGYARKENNTKAKQKHRQCVLKVFGFRFLFSFYFCKLCVGQPRAMCQCWHLPQPAWDADRTKPNRRRQGKPQMRQSSALSSLQSTPLPPPTAFSFQARTVRCKHFAVAAPNFTNNSRHEVREGGEREGMV